MLRQACRLQSAFFYGRTNAFKPMTLADIADSTGLSVSTVSRANARKVYSVQPRRHTAKLFFSAKLEGDSGERSADEAKKYLRQVIDGEDKSAPLSDAQLSDIMTKNGFAISRRTVAKYRDALGIPGTYVRKQS